MGFAGLPTMQVSLTSRIKTSRLTHSCDSATVSVRLGSGFFCKNRKNAKKKPQAEDLLLLLSTTTLAMLFLTLGMHIFHLNIQSF
jgi:hypothetical protein